MEIKIGARDEIIKDADKLRRAVFIDEQGVPEEEIFDGMNNRAVHVVIYVGNNPAATARVLCDGSVWRIGLVAVEKSRRGQHLGVEVMRSAIEYVTANGGKEVVLTAQRQARGFYEKFGFIQCGDEIKYDSGFVLVPMKFVCNQ